MAKRIDVSYISARQMEDWRERLQKLPGFDFQEAIDLAFVQGYGENWPAIAALKYFPKEAQVARG